MKLWIGYIPKNLIHNSLAKGDIRVLRQLKSTGGCQTKYTGATGIQEQRAMFQKEEKNLALESFLLDKDALLLYKLEPKKLFYPTKVCISYLVSCKITKYICPSNSYRIQKLWVMFVIDENNHTSKSKMVTSLENGENEGAEAKSNSLLATKIIWRVKGCLTHSHEADDTGKSLRLSKRVRRNIGLLLKLDLPKFVELDGIEILSKSVFNCSDFILR